MTAHRLYHVTLIGLVVCTLLACPQKKRSDTREDTSPATEDATAQDTKVEDLSTAEDASQDTGSGDAATDIEDTATDIEDTAADIEDAATDVDDASTDEVTGDIPNPGIAYTVVLTGSWSGAWDGDSINVYDDDENLLASLTNSVGGSQSFVVTTPNCITAAYASDNLYGNGNRYEIWGPEGDKLFEDEVPFAPFGYTNCESLSSSNEDAETVCEQWNATWSDMSEGTWSGDIATCDPGDISPEGRANVLAHINLYRWMVGLFPVTTDPMLDAYAQECALILDANNAWTHDPPKDWACYTEDGAMAAGASLVTVFPGVIAVYAGFIVDAGDNNQERLGHRRSLLSNTLGPIGIGTTGVNGATCLWTHNGTGGPGNPWTAWPPPGPVPVDVFKPGIWKGSDGINQTGWSVQTTFIDLTSAQVTVASQGTDMPIKVRSLGAIGQEKGLAFVPDGWTPQAGTTYTVSITGVTPPIEYDIEVVDCGQLSP